MIRALPRRSPGSARTRSCGSKRPARGCARRASRSSTSAWASRARRRRAFIREALAAAITPLAPYPSARRACPSCAPRSRRWAGRRFGATLDPDTEVIPTLGLQGGRVRRSRTCSTAKVVRCRSPRTRSTSAARAFAGKRDLELPLREEDGWLPDLDARRLVARRRSCGSTTRTTRRARPRRSTFYERGRGAGARGTGSCWPPTRRTRSCTSGRAAAVRAAARRPLATSRCFNTLSKRSSMPGYRVGVRRRRPGDRRRAEEVPAERRRRAAGVRPARGDRRLERRGARRPRCARATAPSATRPAARAGGDGPALRPAATRRSSSGWRAPTRSPPRWLEAGRDRRARLVLRPAGAGYLRLALVPPLEAMRARRSS